MRQRLFGFPAIAIVVLLTVGVASRYATTKLQASQDDPDFGRHGQFRSRFVIDHEGRVGMLVVRGRFVVAAPIPFDEVLRNVIEVRPVIDGVKGDVVATEELDPVVIPAGAGHIKRPFLRGFVLPRGWYAVRVTSYRDGRTVRDALGNVGPSKGAENCSRVFVK